MWVFSCPTGEAWAFDDHDSAIEWSIDKHYDADKVIGEGTLWCKNMKRGGAHILAEVKLEHWGPLTLAEEFISRDPQVLHNKKEEWANHHHSCSFRVREYSVPEDCNCGRFRILTAQRQELAKVIAYTLVHGEPVTDPMFAALIRLRK